MVIERNGRFGVRIWDRAARKYEWLGTFTSREEAETLEKAAKARGDTSHGRAVARAIEKAAAVAKGERKPTPPREARQTSLYMCFDEQDDLLYIGITTEQVRRLASHNRRSPWWPKVARMAIKHFDTREEAKREETALIRRLDPPYNHDHRSKPEHVVTLYRKCRNCGQRYRPSDPMRQRAKTWCDRCYSRLPQRDNHQRTKVQK